MNAWAASSSSSSAPRVDAVLLACWGVFWLLLFAVELQGRDCAGAAALRDTLFGEGTAFVVATALLVLARRWERRLDPSPAHPWRWFGPVVAAMLPVALLFVAAVYGLRHGLATIAGRTYEHPPWSQVLPYEVLKFSLFYLLFTGLVFGLRALAAWHEERGRAERMLALSRQARMLQLAQQIEPHFLFNAINTISALIHTAPDRADELLTGLARLLRSTTDLRERTQHRLEEELALLRAYAALMCERFGDRVSLAWDIAGDTAQCLVPALSLQPLLENSFRHVVEARRTPTRILVRVRRESDRLVMSVADDGPPLDHPPSPGVGLENLRQRLETLHGQAAALRLLPSSLGGLESRLELPCAC